MEEIDDFDLIDKDYEAFAAKVMEHLEWEARQLEAEPNEHKHTLVVTGKRDFNKNILGAN